MSRFMATHTAPFTEEQLVNLTNMPLPEGFSWAVTYCDFDDNKFFCEWGAPSKEELAGAFKENNIPYDEIFPVKLFNPAKKELEP